ncbi:hypothetical protein [Alloprevotella tannerae]|jgi:conserved domain protein|uniref:hypothetical protein n=1 Tax=Alloprevotella tannerae TaxID=76122 RepID=UPI0028E1DA69|nr:hypothetical protein [Alloprevotella tannerae]
MPQNKNAVIRYQALDRCSSDFRHFRHRYYIDDLIDACAEALIEYTGQIVRAAARYLMTSLLWRVNKDGVFLWNVTRMERKYIIGTSPAIFL